MVSRNSAELAADHTDSEMKSLHLTLSRSVTTAPSSRSFSTMLCLLSRAANINGVKPLSCEKKDKRDPLVRARKLVIEKCKQAGRKQKHLRGFRSHD